MGMHGCQVCKWMALGKKPVGRMMSPAKCNCLPREDKLKAPRGGAAINEIMNKLAKKEVDIKLDASYSDLKAEVGDTVIIDLADTAKKRRGRPPRAKL